MTVTPCDSCAGSSGAYWSLVCSGWLPLFVAATVMVDTVIGLERGVRLRSLASLQDGLGVCVELVLAELVELVAVGGRLDSTVYSSRC